MKTADSVSYTTLGNEAIALLDNQCEQWQLCGDNYKNLERVQFKSFTLKDKTIHLQWNPARITSTAAKVDAKSISERKCFLCSENRPAVQEGIAYNEQFTVLVNPFPIFPKHYTIIHKQHVPQQIEGHFYELLQLTKALGEHFVVFYNGPRCGASAPDHHHFQAGNKGFLPIEHEIGLMKKQAMATLSSGHVTTWFVNDSVRKLVVIEGNDESAMHASFSRVMSSLRLLNESNEEPLLNILSYYNLEPGKNTIIIILREKHRPACYFAEDDSRILLSPAAVDLGGVCVTPREEDFNKLTAADIHRIFNEVFPSDEYFFRLQNEVSALM